MKKRGKKSNFLFSKLQNGLLVFLLVAFLELFLLAGYFGILPSGKLIASIAVDTLVQITNITRKERGVDTLEPNPLLEEAAGMKAEDMAERGYFAHTSPDGKTPWYWFDKVGYDYSHAGENLAVNFVDPEAVNNAWMRSPDHRDNIINKNFEEIGIATAEGDYKGEEAIFIVQLFGRKADVERIHDSEQEIIYETVEEDVLGAGDQDFEDEVEKSYESEESLEGKAPLENKESFVLVQREKDQNPSYVVEAIEGRDLKIRNEEIEDYPTLFLRIFSEQGNLLGYLLVILGGSIFLPTILKDSFSFRKNTLKHCLIDSFIMLGIIFLAISTTHYILVIAQLIS